MGFADPKVNLLAMIILGLRLLFFKTIVFNVLMTVRLWMSQCECDADPVHLSSRHFLCHTEFSPVL